MTRDQLVARLKRAGERATVSGEENQPGTRLMFDAIKSGFHGGEWFLRQIILASTAISRLFSSAFGSRSIRRGIIVAEGNDVACQTWIEGVFVREFTQSPAGALPPDGQRVVWDLGDRIRFDAIRIGWSRSGYGPTIGVFSDSSGPKRKITTPDHVVRRVIKKGGAMGANRRCHHPPDRAPCSR